MCLGLPVILVSEIGRNQRLELLDGRRPRAPVLAFEPTQCIEIEPGRPRNLARRAARFLLLASDPGPYTGKHADLGWCLGHKSDYARIKIRLQAQITLATDYVPLPLNRRRYHGPPMNWDPGKVRDAIQRAVDAYASVHARAGYKTIELKAGLSEGTVRKFVTGGRRNNDIQLSTIIAFAGVLGMTVSELIGESDQRPPQANAFDPQLVRDAIIAFDQFAAETHLQKVSPSVRANAVVALYSVFKRANEPRIRLDDLSRSILQLALEPSGSRTP